MGVVHRPIKVVFAFGDIKLTCPLLRFRGYLDLCPWEFGITCGSCNWLRVPCSCSGCRPAVKLHQQNGIKNKLLQLRVGSFVRLEREKDVGSRTARAANCSLMKSTIPCPLVRRYGIDRGGFIKNLDDIHDRMQPGVDRTLK